MFRFTEDCLIGDEQLDREHEHLFELINSILEMIHNQYVSDRYSQIKGLLQELDDYAEQHFTHEEAYMEKILDPELIIQRSQHMVFRDKVREWEFKDIDEFQEQVDTLKEMMLFLAEWLYQHIIGSDTMIGKLPPLEEWMVKEDICQFSEEYLVGNELIDNEHKELFRLIGKANTMVREGIDASRCDEVMDILAELKEYGVNLGFVTLHVGLGTFRPVNVENIEEHVMHKEYYSISQETADLIINTKAAGKRVIAVGTTSIRTLESAADGVGRISGKFGWTDIFIYPGYEFKLVDGIVTNFHLPKSTLIMLISAFAGREFVLKAYETAVQEKYRFFSFGDAMLIRRPGE